MFDEEPDAPLHGECAAEIHRLQAEVETLQRDAIAWRQLCELAGHWQDSSMQTVALVQDDATREYGIRVGDEPTGPRRHARRYYWASSFAAALERAVAGES